MVIRQRIVAVFVVALLGIVILFLNNGNAADPQTAGAEPAGKKLFLDNKCNVCHPIEAAGVTKKGPTATAAASETKKGPPDLSTVGSTRAAEWITKYLKKEEAIEGKKHAKVYTGKDEDLKVLADWLASLKKK